MAIYNIPSDRVVTWEPGVTVGVIGGIPTNRSTVIDVTQSPYFASGSNAQTSGTISSGSPTLSVASSSTFSIGNGIKVGYQEVQQLVINSGCSSDGHVTIRIPGNGTTSRSIYDVDVVNGDTASQVATKIRDTTFRGWTTGGSGTTVTFTFYTSRVLGTTVSLDSALGVTATGSVVTPGVIAAFTSISNVVGNTITLSVNASSSISSGLVEHDDTVSINAAVAAAVAANNGTIAYLPAGTYIMSSGIGSGTAGAGSNYTIRGAGSGQLTGEALTLIDFSPDTESAAIRVGSTQTNNLDWTVSGSPQKGDSSITLVESIAGFTSNQIVRFSILNQLDEADIQSGETVVISDYGYEYVRCHVAKIETVNTGTGTITFTPPLPFDLPSDLLPRMAHYGYNSVSVGIEDLAIDLNESFVGIHVSAGIVMEQSINCWMLNVKVTRVPQRNIEINNCVHCEIRHSFTDLRSGLGGSNGAGLNFSTNGGCLVIDNIFSRQFPLLEVNTGCTSSAFLYNYFLDSRVFGISGVAIDTNHAPHNSFILYEGNITPNIQCDGYYGSTSDDTLYRNFIASSNPGGLGLVSVILNRFTRNYNIVGNILGTSGSVSGSTSYGNPNFANGSSTGTAEPSIGDFWTDFEILGTVASSNTITVPKASNLFVNQLVGVTYGTSGLTNTFASISNISGTTVTFSSGTFPSNGTSVRIWAGVGDGGAGKGFQELDLDVLNTTILKANYYSLAIGGGAIPGGESLAGDTLEDSLAFSSKPSFFGSLSWPPFDTSSPNQSIEAIPAGYRYINGEEPPPDSTVSTPAFSPVAGTFGSAQNVTITTATSGATIRYTTDGSTPTNSYGTIYSSPIVISSTSTLKAIAYDGILSDSSVRSGTYTILASSNSITIGGTLTPSAIVFA